jgi:hypothetical protein
VGPIGIAHVVSRAVDMGLERLLTLFALLNISIGLLNLLPIPMLDGGRFVIMFVEGIRERVFGRGLFNKEKEAVIHFVGLALLLVVAVIISAGDVGRIAKKDDLVEQVQENVRMSIEEEWQNSRVAAEDETATPGGDEPQAEADDQGQAQRDDAEQNADPPPE